MVPYMEPAINVSVDSMPVTRTHRRHRAGYSAGLLPVTINMIATGARGSVQEWFPIYAPHVPVLPALLVGSLVSGRAFVPRR